MNSFHVVNARLVLPDGVRPDSFLTVEAGRVTAIGDMRDGVGGYPIVDIAGDHLMPGFIDVQVNGGGGVLLNDAPTVATIARIGEAHARYGTTGFLPTLISDDLDVIDAAMRAVEEAIKQGVPGVLGIHIEGPFIATARKGIHDPAKFRKLDQDSIALLSGLKRGRTLVTLAPETCTPDDIRALVANGVIVAAGHTDADYATTRAALDAGMTGFTHLYNAMSPMSHRAPGVVGAALESRDAFTGIIADGHHVDDAVLRITMQARPVDRCMLVTDAMPTVGAPDKTFMLNGRIITVRDGVCVAEDGTLAGCDLDMTSAVRNIMAATGVDLASASTMASSAPAAFLRLSETVGAIGLGRAADLVWLGNEGRPRQVWRSGVSAVAYGNAERLPEEIAPVAA